VKAVPNGRPAYDLVGPCANAVNSLLDGKGHIKLPEAGCGSAITSNSKPASIQSWWTFRERNLRRMQRSRRSSLAICDVVPVCYV
jgi:hypothetical protein